MGRFDYVRYDETAMERQAHCKKVCEDLEHAISASIKPGRAQSLALTKLEEVYMWIGKAIRDDQIERNGSASLQEERNNE